MEENTNVWSAKSYKHFKKGLLSQKRVWLPQAYVKGA